MRYDLYINFKENKSEREIIYHEGESHYNKYSSDKIKITNKRIKIELNRTGNKDMEAMIKNYKSTVNKQINKSLCYIACVSGRIPEIKKVLLVDINGKRIDFNFENINQPLKKPISNKFKIRDIYLLRLFNSNETADILLITISLWLKGITEDLEGEKFDKLWKSFNSIYSKITGGNSEFQKLVAMRKFIIDNFEKCHRFKISVDYFEDFDSNKIRQLRWREMILNDYKEDSQTEAFQSFIYRYKDFRINQVFREILPYREQSLKRKNLYNDTLAYINKNINDRQKHNVEILAFYTLKYSYFVRNKYFHGEKLDSTFHLIKNDEVKELSLLNDILSILIKELIENNDLY